MCIHSKCSRLTSDVTGSFKLGVIKGDFTSILITGSCTVVDIPCSGRQSSFFCKTTPFKLFHDIIVGSHRILMEQNLRKFLTPTLGCSFSYVFHIILLWDTTQP